MGFDWAESVTLRQRTHTFKNQVLEEPLKTKNPLDLLVLRVFYKMVELIGVEPTTPCLQSRCSTN
jgi:hypothetical protein